MLFIAKIYTLFTGLQDLQVIYIEAYRILVYTVVSNPSIVKSAVNPVTL